MLRVLQLNVWATGGDWPARRRVLRTGIAQLQPDLVALEETVLTRDVDQAADLLGPSFHLVQSKLRSRDGLGITLASRHPIARTHEVDLRLGAGRPGDFAPCAVLAEVRLGEPFGRVIFVNHLPSWEVDAEGQRELQSVLVARTIDTFVGEDAAHVIVAGDMDADPASASIRFWTGRQSIDGMSVCYRDAWEAEHPGEPGDTFTPENPLVADPDWPFRRIDYVLVRCGDHRGPTLRIEDCRRVFDEPIDGTWASDHFGVVADLGAPAS